MAMDSRSFRRLRSPDRQPVLTDCRAVCSFRKLLKLLPGKSCPDVSEVALFREWIL
jgi:hypothetical protein